MARTIEADITILGGLPVHVKAQRVPAEPEVGIMSEGLEDIQLYWHSGSELSQKIYDRISVKEWERIDGMIWENHTPEDEGY